MDHVPVLLKEVIEYLKPSSGKKYIDATIGNAGHALEIAKSGAEVLGIDRDPEAVSRATNRERRIKVVRGNFADLKEIAETEAFSEVDGILLDLGMGSHQLDDEKRGFAFQKTGPLDMRYDQSQGKAASEFVNFHPEGELVKIFRDFGEEKRWAKKIARAILVARKMKAIESTSELFELIKAALPSRFRFRAGDVTRRVFQALRVAVNQELKNIEQVLPQALDILKLHGILIVISFHSLEDRIVKRFFVRESKNCVCPPEFPVCRCDARARLRILTKKLVTAGEIEIKNNSRAKSAKLRAAQKIWDDSSRLPSKARQFK